MKKFLLLICLLGIVSCEKEEKTLPFSTGITGIVKYGEGDCMPIFDRDEADYDNFTGELYFIIKSELEALGEGNFEGLLDKSISTNVKNGV
ncbi:MAG TPA: hypothetical protein VFM59_00045, partial [Salinimicrobium sp.]|nr:hypothetical protein [Salinimicrobium sp.]